MSEEERKIGVSTRTNNLYVQLLERLHTTPETHRLGNHASICKAAGSEHSSKQRASEREREREKGRR